MMSDKKTIFLINLKGNPDKLDALLRRFLTDVSGPHLMVFFNLEIPLKFKIPSMNVKTSEEFLTANEYEAIDNDVFENLSKNWYLYKDITSYRNIHLGKLFEYEFQKFLIPRIKNLRVIRNISLREKVKKFIIIEDTGELHGAARMWAKKNKIVFFSASFSRKNALLSVFRIIKESATSLLACILDNIALKKIRNFSTQKATILTDAKLTRSICFPRAEFRILLSPLDKGIGVRMDLLKRDTPYLPIPHFQKNALYWNNRNALKKTWERLANDGRFKSIFEFDGVSFWGIVDEWLSVLFLKSIPRAIGTIEFLTNFLRDNNVKISLLRNDVKELERTIIFSGRLAGVPSLVLQHGILAEKNGHNILLADKFLGWGKGSIQWYAAAGNPPEKIEVTGNPRFDTLGSFKPLFSKQLLCEKLNLRDDKGIVLFATQQVNKFSSFWTDDLFLAMADKLIDALRDFPDKQLVIKTDPYEDIAPYRDRIAAGSYPNAVAVKEIDLYTLMYFSELVVTMDSTVGLEALAFDKPLITINLSRRTDRVPYAASEAAIGVKNSAELSSALMSVFFDAATAQRLKSARGKFLKEYASYGNIGNAREKIAILVAEMAKN